MTEDRDSLEDRLRAIVDTFGFAATEKALKHLKLKPPGRPIKIMESEEFYIWLKIEAFKFHHPNYSESDRLACEKFIEENGFFGFAEMVLSDDGTRCHKIVREIKNAETLRRRYNDAQKTYRDDKNTAAAWNRALADVTGQPHRPEDRVPNVTGIILGGNTKD